MAFKGLLDDPLANPIFPKALDGARRVSGPWGTGKTIEDMRNGNYGQENGFFVRHHADGTPLIQPIPPGTKNSLPVPPPRESGLGR